MPRKSMERLLVACHLGNFGESGCLMDGTVLVLAADGPSVKEAFESDACDWEGLIAPDVSGNPPAGGLWVLEGSVSAPKEEDDDPAPVRWRKPRWRRLYIGEANALRDRDNPWKE